ncbi:DUF2442 domain-containing protein [Rhizobium oryzicola]|uniref:DUF2442 domain-containing protein n=1 Tax=Rhizobium oryzicola TaxID=1232668 RepID=A0ABT8ST89_9HYPH|nr:DUF2442 domain-containing protein [Rhizobium oryzicola]MDO1581536.1 DUF2442 domain-containing protein [Rhizobium oryzicola]
MSNELITVGEPLPRISHAEILKDRVLRIRWRSGHETTVDLAPVLLSRRAFMPLREDDELFRQISVEEHGTALEWPQGIDLSALWLSKLPSVSFNNADFRNAMEELGMTLEGMAAALEISRRQVADYRKAKPIPKSIAFATRYLVDIRRSAS